MTKCELDDIILGTVTVGERGQIVIPASARKRLDIHAGDQLFMMSHPSGQGLGFVKTSAMRDFIEQMSSRLEIAMDLPVETMIETVEPEKKKTTANKKNSVKGLAWLLVPILGMMGLFSGAANAQKMTVDDAVQAALAHNPKMQIARENIQKASAQVDQAFAAGLPKISINSNYTQNDQASVISPETSSGGNMAVTQSLDVFGMTRTAKSAAVYGKAAYSFDAQRAANDVTLDAKTAYFNVLRARRGLTVQEDTVAQLKAHLTDAESFFNSGTIAKFDVLRAQTQLANAQQGLISAQNGVKLAESSFNNVLNRPLDTPVDLEDPGEPAFIKTELASCVDAACQSRPEVLQSTALLGMNEKIVDATRINGKPKFNLSWTYNRNFNAIGIYTRDSSWVGLIGASMNLFDGGATRAAIAQAQSDANNSKSQKEQVVQGVSLDAQQAYLSLHESEQRIQAAKIGKDQADESMRLAQVRYKGGVSTQVEVLDAQAALTLAGTNYVNALYDYHVALAKLERAVGGHDQFAKLTGPENQQMIAKTAK